LSAMDENIQALVVSMGAFFRSKMPDRFFYNSDCESFTDLF